MDTSNLKAIISDSMFFADEIEKRLIDSGGEITKEIEEIISYSNYNLKELELSVDITAMALERIDVLREYYNQQINAIGGILDGLSKVEKKLNSNLELALSENNITSLSGDLKSITLRKNPPKVDVWNETLIPEDYRKISITETINKMQISNDLKEGKEIPGCRLVQGNSIKIGQAKPKIGDKK